MKEERTCIACRQSKNKHELLRIAKINNEYKLDINNNLQGRGAYICKNKECLNLCVKKRCLNKAFKCAVSNDVYDILLEYEKNN